MPLIPAIRRQRQVGLCEFEASLVYRVSSRTDSIVTGNPVSRNKQTKKIIGKLANFLADSASSPGK